MKNIIRKAIIPAAGFGTRFLPAAKSHFIDHHLDRVSHEFRCQYCGSRCEVRHHCSLAAGAGAIPSLHERQSRLP